MRNKKMIVSITMFGIFLISSLTLGACKKHKEVDLSSIHTTAASTPAQTMASTKEAAPSTAASTEASTAAKAPKTLPKTYTEGNLKIEHPEIQGMEDEEKLLRINKLIEDNAKALVSGLGLDSQKDTLDIGFTVVSLDKKRMIITYKGTYSKKDGKDKINVFYTNNIDLNMEKNLGLNDFTDGYTMAGYILSDDVILADADENTINAFKAARNEKTIEEYTEIFNNADFSEKGEGNTLFPQSFSYVKNGDIYFSVPVDHSLGDYVIVKYSPSSK